MLYHAKSETVHVENTATDYVVFGTGEKTLVMIPGLGDGLRTVKGMANSLAIMYRLFAKDYKVYIFSRPNQLPQIYSTKDMARDLVQAMQKLNIHRADVIGVSQGGMIAQQLSIFYPEMVEHLVLAVTMARDNAIAQATVGEWIQLAREKRHGELTIAVAEKSYSQAKLKQYRRLYPILTKLTKPQDYTRFLIQANSCLQHNTYDDLEKIQCETLVIGGARDQVVGAEASRELAKLIPNSELYIYEDYGHSAYEEAKDFNSRVLKFLQEEKKRSDK